jgi:1,4-dihydroxy-2-naphthoyl-CoA hydrolase
MNINIAEKANLEVLNQMNANTIMEVLGITYTEIGADYICASMPVDRRTHQPVGLLHGGASAVLAESLGSMGSAIIADLRQNSVTGIEINANHIRGVKNGNVYAKASIIHCGKTTHIWNIEIKDDQARLVCLARLTVLILPKNK